MTHLEAVATLISTAAEGAAVREHERGAAERHVARCSDCWSIVETIQTVTSGDAASDRSGLAGAAAECESVRDGLYLLVRMSRDEIAARASSAGRHLAGCPACRERFATLLLVERELAAVARPAVAAPSEAPLVVAVGRRVAAFVRWASDFVDAGAILAPEPARGGGALEPVTGARSVRVSLGASGTVALLTVGLQDAGTIAIDVTLEGTCRTSGTVALRASGVHGDLVALATISPRDSTKLAGVPCGRYRLEIRESALASPFRTDLDIEHWS